jgi:hypothetical protein
MHCADREVSLEKRGTQAEQFNAVFGAWLGACLSLRRSLQKLSLQAAPRHRPIASLWKTRLSIALIRENFGLEKARSHSSDRYFKALR